MDWLKNNGDRVALLLISLLAIGGAGMMIAKSLSFSDGFVYEYVTEENKGRTVPETGKESVGLSREAIDLDAIWKLPAISGKAEVPLFKSVVLIQKGSQIFDLNATNGQPLRPPMTNAFLLEHELDYTRTDVGELDKDKDGFDNLEEFFGVGNGVRTDPSDPESHPPHTDKLFVKERIEIPYILVFSGSSDDLYQVGEKKEGGRMNRLFVKKGQKFFNDRFTALSHETKPVFVESVQEEQPRGVLTVQDNLTEETIELVQRVEKNLPSFIGVFLYTWKADMEIQAKKGETFKIPGDQRTFKLGEIMESEALIVPADAEGKPIEGAPQIRIPSLSTRGNRPSAPAPPVTLPTPVTPTPPTPVPGGTPAPGTGTTPAPGTGTAPAVPAPGTTTPAPSAIPGSTAPGTGTTPAPGTSPAPAPGTTPVPAPGTSATPPAPGSGVVIPPAPAPGTAGPPPGAIPSLPEPGN